MLQIENNLQWLSRRCRMRVFVTSAATVLAFLLLLHASVSGAEGPNFGLGQSEWQRVTVAAKKKVRLLFQCRRAPS